MHPGWTISSPACSTAVSHTRRTLQLSTFNLSRGLPITSVTLQCSVSLESPHHGIWILCDASEGRYLDKTRDIRLAVLLDSRIYPGMGARPLLVR